MSNRVLFLLIAGVFFVFASIFLIIGIIYEKIYQNNMKGYDKDILILKMLLVLFIEEIMVELVKQNIVQVKI